MKLLFLSYILSIGLNYKSPSNNTQASRASADTAKKIYENPVSVNPITKGLKYLVGYDVYKDTLYVINNDVGKLIKFDLKSGKIATNATWNGFLGKLVKENKQVNQLLVRDDGCYLTVLNQLYNVSSNGRFNKSYLSKFMLDDFNFINDKYILTAKDSVKLISKSGKFLSEIPFVLADNGYFKSTEGISYAPIPEEPVYDFQIDQTNNIRVKKSAPITSYSNVKEPFILYSNDKFYVIMSYTDRNKIYIIKKDENRIYKQILLPGSTNTPTMEAIQDEEGNPNFKVGYSDGTYYCVVLINKKLKVFSFKI